MMIRTGLYRVTSWLRHHLTARNTGGHGVHSPYLFEWVRMILHDKHPYYVWEDIEAIRAELLRDGREIEYVDYGSGAKETGQVSKRKVCDIARGSLEVAKYGQLLSRLAVWLSRCQSTSLNILELGTSFGVTTAYMAMADSRNKVVSCEGCAAVADIAQENWKRLGISNIECVVGELTVESLQLVVDCLKGKIDMAFIDANHTHASTQNYFNVLAEKVHEKSVIVVDDIHYSEDMEKAWREICADERVTSTIDLYQMGLVFFDTHYWKRNYRIRI